MPVSDFQPPKLSLAFAKIVAAPTNTSWAQAYNAGSLFTAIALTTTSGENQNQTLSATGKELFSALNAEFFSLETKNLLTIKSALEKSITILPSDIIADICVCFFKDNILYLYIAGKGKAVIKRDGRLGTVLEKNDEDRHIVSASGILMPSDTVFIATDQIGKTISESEISEAFKSELPNEIAEGLAPKIHQTENGAQAAIIITYNGSSLQPPLNSDNDFPPPVTSDPPPSPKAPLVTDSPKNKFHVKLSLPPIRLTLIQKISLAASMIIFITLVSGIIYTKSQQENDKLDSLFVKIMSQAEKDYKEGQELAKVNSPTAGNTLAKAETVLKENINKFKPDSPEHAKLNNLLNLIQKELVPSPAPVNKISPSQVELDKNHFLNLAKTEKAISLNQNDSFIYILTQKSITTVNRTNEVRKDIIQNNNDWDQPVDIVPYQSNIYVMDKKEGILKYITAQSGYGKTGYFQSARPDLTSSKSMAIDGSVWILKTNGEILKYTRGGQDAFTISGLEKPLKNPSKIFTLREIDHLYILDNGNSRIVKLSKNGTFQDHYYADILNSATGFEIIEEEQKAIILSNNQTYSLPL